MSSFYCKEMINGTNIEWMVVFKNSEYTTLNNFKFDVRNVTINNHYIVRGTVHSTTTPVNEVKFDLLTTDKYDKYRQFSNWFMDVFSTCNKKCFRPYYVDATLYLFNSDTGKLIREYSLVNIFPISVNDISDTHKEINFKATFTSVKDVDNSDKENNIKKDSNSDCKDNVVNNSNDELRSIVKLIEKLDDIEDYVDKNKLPSSWKSVGDTFVESLRRYNNLLKDKCINSIKELYK